MECLEDRAAEGRNGIPVHPPVSPPCWPDIAALLLPDRIDDGSDLKADIARFFTFLKSGPVVPDPKIVSSIGKDKPAPAGSGRLLSGFHNRFVESHSVLRN